MVAPREGHDVVRPAWLANTRSCSQSVIAVTDSLSVAPYLVSTTSDLGQEEDMAPKPGKLFAKATTKLGLAGRLGDLP
jgi:hypothetical protein